jgi:hypothetical protein
LPQDHVFVLRKVHEFCVLVRNQVFILNEVLISSVVVFIVENFMIMVLNEICVFRVVVPIMDILMKR